MGNQQSSSTQTPKNVAASHAGAHRDRDRERDRPPAPAPHLHIPHVHHTARRRESIAALHPKAQAAAPTPSLQHAESHSPSVVANQLRAAQDNFKSTLNDAMGNEQSSQKGQQREKAHPTRDATPPHPQPTSPPPPETAQQHPPSEPQPAPEPQARPINVPAVPREEPQGSRADDPAGSIGVASASQHEYIVPSSHFSRPPRLPLPIEEENHQPGSPVISSIDHEELEGALPRHESMLSSTTADDEDLGDEFKGPTTGRPTVPTLIEWEGEGERVYVTGTFAGWNRKYKLNRNGPSKKKDALSAYVHITPGTHHLMFIVDNDMRTSDKLPTAVDYTNILVNYLEVSLDDVPHPPAAAPEQTDKQKLDAATPVQDREKPSGIYPPQTLPPTPEMRPLKAPLPEPAQPKAPEPKKKYHQKIPRYLVDLDAPEESSKFSRANAMTNNLPTPPTLPGFLGKSILNGTTPHKDDSSVLIMPNHTVLNHLATSSIKDNILATSATTRYKQKFLTTIMYKPKEEDPDRY